MNDDTLAWVMLYSSILGIAHHPRQMETGEPVMTSDEAARRTDDAMRPFRERVKNGELG